MSELSSSKLAIINSAHSTQHPTSHLHTHPPEVYSGEILLFKPPFFTPWTPPLGIAILKSYMEQNGFRTRCVDFNTDVQLWNLHHGYFRELQMLETVSINDGYSKLWWILNAHLLAHVNGASQSTCVEMLETITPLYAVRCNRTVARNLATLVNSYFQRLEDLLSQLDVKNVAIAGTSTYTTSLASSLFILRRLKILNPLIVTVMGGGIFADDLALGSENLETLLTNYSYIDHMVLGEGEQLFLELAHGRLKHKRVISIADLDQNTMEIGNVPIPDFTDFDSSAYYHLTIEGARSCPFECSFCSETIQWGKFRKKTPAMLVDQLSSLATRHGNNSFFMGDSLMNPYIVQLSAELLNRNANLLYDGYLRADNVATSDERVRQWAQSGLYRVRLGVESASAKVLKAMHKMTTPETISGSLKYLSRHGVRTTTYWIVGFPGETEEDFEETLDFIVEHHRSIYELEAHPFYYYPYGQVGSRFYSSRSLYPETVTDLIKFRVWDIAGVEPDRYQRYRRLSRISKLAAQLGLLNIYTMTTRYDAEERWRRLHPLTREVYGSSLPSRSRRSGSDENATLRETTAVIGHLIRIDTPLDMLVLEQTVSELPAFNELRGSAMLRSFTLEAQPEGGDHTRELFCNAVEEMNSELSLSLMVAINTETPAYLLFLTRESVTDGYGLKLLIEDAFAIYSQLSTERSISLPTMAMTWSEAEADFGTARMRPACKVWPAQRESFQSQSSIIKSIVNGSVRSPRFLRLLSTHEIQIRKSLEAVLLAAIAKSVQGVNTDIDITCDYRTCNERLRNVPGALAYLHRLSASHVERIMSNTGINGVISFWRKANADREAFPDSHGQTPKLHLVNTECLAEEPWFDHPNWHACGYVFDAPLPNNYTFEHRLSLTTSGEVQLEVKHLDLPGMQECGSAIAIEFNTALLSWFEDLERDDRIHKFWSDELTDAGLLSADPAVRSVGRAVASGSSQSPVPLDVDAVHAIACRHLLSESDVVFACYALAAAWLTTQDAPLMIESTKQGSKLVELPVRIPFKSDMTLLSAPHVVSNRRARAAAHSYHAIQIANSILLESQDRSIAECARLGFSVYHDVAPVATDIFKLFTQTGENLDVILLVDQRSGHVQCYLATRLGEAGEEFSRIISRVMADTLRCLRDRKDITIADLYADLERSAELSVAELSTEAFQFNA